MTNDMQPLPAWALVCVLKLVDAAKTGNTIEADFYATQLADKLERSGQHDEAERVRRAAR